MPYPTTMINMPTTVTIWSGDQSPAGSRPKTVGAAEIRARPIVIKTKDAINANREFENGRVNPTFKIGAALRKDSETGILDDEGED